MKCADCALCDFHYFPLLYRIKCVHHILLQIKQNYYRKLCNAEETQGQYVNGKVYHLHGQRRTNIFIPVQIAC